MNDICDQLDDYLDGLLDTSATGRFDDHLTNCETCREAVQFEQALAASVRASDHGVNVPPPLTGRIQVAIRRWERRRHMAWAVGIAACLLVTGSLALRVGPRVDRPAAIDETSPRIAEQNPQPIDTQPPDRPPAVKKAVVRVAGEGRPSHIALARPTRSEHVTFVMLLPTIGPRDMRTDDDR